MRNTTIICASSVEIKEKTVRSTVSDCNDSLTLNPLELKVFLNHVYEFKKGIRQMVLYTCNKKMKLFMVNRLESQDIPYFIQMVGEENMNFFFGRSECIEVVRHLVTCPLNQLSPEQDFILGALLGYDVCGQCRRYCKQMMKKSA